MQKPLSRLHLRLLTLVGSILLTGILYIFNVDNIVHVAMSILILSGLLLLTTTPAIYIMRIVGVVVVIACVWLGTTDFMLRTLETNCVLQPCESKDSSAADDIVRYAQFIQNIYPDEEWVEPFSLELAEMMKRFERTQYYPYTGSRSIPFDGEYAYVNAEGLRPVPQSRCHDEDAYRVFVFGNSAMYGTYEPNKSMLAALIQERLDESLTQSVCLINYAQGRWNSTQSLLQLINLIQEDTLPDLVISYEGATDVLAASNYKRANVPLATDFMARRIGATTSPYRPEQNLELWLRNTMVVQQFLDSFHLPNVYPEPDVTYEEPFYLTEPVSAEAQVIHTANVYLTNYELAQLLGEQYEFEVVYFVQPVSFYGQKILTSKEQFDLEKGWPGQIHQDLYQQVYGILKDEADQTPNLYFLGEVFDGVTEEVYGDPIHVLPNGNEMIADEIGSIMAERLSTR